MLQAFIITLREGVEAALIVSITLAYLAKIGRDDLRKSVYAGLAAAFAGSIAVAVVVSRLKLNEEIFEGWVMLVAAVFVVTMIVFMMKTGRKLKGEIEGKVGLFASGDAWIGLFLFVFLMVMREGVETVLILSAVTLNSSQLTSFIGTLSGVIVAILFGVMFVKGSVKINLQKFFRVTTAILFLVAGQLVISGLHELSENGVLPSSRQEMAIIGPIVRNDFFFFITILALAALMVLFEMKSRQPVALPAAGAARAHGRVTGGHGVHHGHRRPRRRIGRPGRAAGALPDDHDRGQGRPGGRPVNAHGVRSGDPPRRPVLPGRQHRQRPLGRGP